MIKTFIKYIIHSLWVCSSRAAKKNYVSFDYGSQMIFNLLIGLLVYTIILFLLISVSTIFPVIINDLGKIILGGMLLIWLSAPILKYSLNYEWIKKTTITKKEKQLCRLILIVLICLIIIIKWIYKN